MAKVPLLGAVQDHHTELIVPFWLGSPTSEVAPIFEPVLLTGTPVSTIRLAKLSFTTLEPSVVKFQVLFPVMPA